MEHAPAFRQDFKDVKHRKVCSRSIEITYPVCLDASI